MAKDYKHMDEAALMARFRADGNTEWLGIILERFTLVLLGVCMKYLKDEDHAKDAVQQVFLKALSEVPKYEIDNIGGWLYQVAKNHCLSALRSKKDYASDEPLKYIPQPDEVPLSLLIQKEQDIDRMKDALKDIKEEQRICVASFYLDKKSYAQIAAETGWDIKQVKSNIQNGKRNLRLRLEA